METHYLKRAHGMIEDFSFLSSWDDKNEKSSIMTCVGVGSQKCESIYQTATRILIDPISRIHPIYGAGRYCKGIF